MTQGGSTLIARHLARPWSLVAPALVLWSAMAAPAVAQTVSFVARRDFAAGTSPSSVTVSDFNGDGAQGLAVANLHSSVSALLGNGDGTFRAAMSFPAGSHPNSVASGDFDGDGKLDLATANLDSNDVSVLLGNGDGTFRAAMSFPVGSGSFYGPMSVAERDVNGDRAPDLAAGPGPSGSVMERVGK